MYNFKIPNDGESETQEAPSPIPRQIRALVTETDELHPFMERKTIL